MTELRAATPRDACWSRIGVWGEGNCPQLAAQVHCRNCPVYAAAAAQMLDGASPDGYVEEWTRHFAGGAPTLARDTQSVVIFRINAEWVALPVSALVEVVERRPLHSLPHPRSHFLKGVVNIRGQLLLCVSLTRVLDLAERTAAEKTHHTTFERLLVVATDEGRLVFPVSEVFGLWRYESSELREVPATVARGGPRFTKAVLAWQHSRHTDRTEKSLPPERISVGLLDEQVLFQTINRGLT